jgi:hypothetical protein
MEYLNARKKEGLSVKETVIKSILSVRECFNNEVSLKTTKEVVTPIVMLESLASKIRADGANSDQLREIDIAIEKFNKVLKDLADGQGGTTGG